VLSDPAAREHLARLGFDRVVTTPLDGETTRVSFFNGRRWCSRRRCRAAGRSSPSTAARTGTHDWAAGGAGAAVLAAMLAVFLLATLRLPLRRIENLDARAGRVVVPVVLLNERYVGGA
jgi:hypothetical protein